MTGFGWTEGRCWFWRERDMRTNQGGVSLTRETSRTRGTRDKIGDRHKNPPQSVLSRRQMALLRISHFHSVAAICWTINGLVAGTRFGAGERFPTTATQMLIRVESLREHPMRRRGRTGGPRGSFLSRNWTTDRGSIWIITPGPCAQKARLGLTRYALP